MKFNNLLLPGMIVILSGLMILNSCGGNDDEVTITFESNPQQFCIDNPADTRCFDINPDAYCDINPLDDRCCIPTQDIDCYCSADDNATTDTENCCLFDYNPNCFCEANPDDSRCVQDFGEGNGLGLLVNFEQFSEADDVVTSLINPFQMDNAEFNGVSDVEAVEGDTYLSLIYRPVANAEYRWNDFKYWPAFDTESPTDKLIDLNDLNDPYINFWINTGTNEADTMALTIAFRDETISTDYDKDFLFKESTGGDWKLMSIRLADVTFRRAYNSDDTGSLSTLAPDLQFTLIKFVFRSAPWVFPERDNTDFVAAIDAISITDGPLVQLPWTR